MQVSPSTISRNQGFLSNRLYIQVANQFEQNGQAKTSQRMKALLEKQKEAINARPLDKN